MSSSHTISTESPTPHRRGLRRPTAAVGSIVVHLALIGGLWSAQIVPRNEFRLAGARGSVDLQASVAIPTPTETPVVERMSPTEVRVEPDHTHVDRRTIWTVPPVEPPSPTIREATEPVHEHHHPHEHEPHVHEKPPTATELNTPITPPSTATNASVAATTGHDETLPAPQHNPPPEYPVEAHRAAIEGTTVLRVGVRSDGGVEFVEIAQSSGDAALDRAAVAAVQRWRFAPGRVRGSAAAFILRLPIVFKL